LARWRWCIVRWIWWCEVADRWWLLLLLLSRRNENNQSL
jgi:hypothetical protein